MAGVRLKLTLLWCVRGYTSAWVVLFTVRDRPQSARARSVPTALPQLLLRFVSSLEMKTHFLNLNPAQRKD